MGAWAPNGKVSESVDTQNGPAQQPTPPPTTPPITTAPPSEPESASPPALANTPAPPSPPAPGPLDDQNGDNPAGMDDDTSSSRPKLASAPVKSKVVVLKRRNPKRNATPKKN